LADLVVKDLSVTYNGSQRSSLVDISFEAHLGELIIFAGSSGCGKSTLAKSILTLIPKYYSAEIKGTLSLNGTDIQYISREELIKNIGYVPQYPADFTTSMLVEEEVAFPLENLLSSPSDINDRIQQIFTNLNIRNLQKRLITELSSGELQKVALAAAIAPKPKVLVLDEPMARLDPKSEIELTQLLIDIAKQGTLVLVFEHRLDSLLAVADRVIILDEGKIKIDGKPREIIAHLDEVDVPEVALLKVKGQRKGFLSLNEAVDYITSSNIIDSLF